MLTLLILIIEAIWNKAKLYWSNLEKLTQSISIMGLRDASASKNVDCLVIHHNFLVMKIIHMPPQPPFYSWPYPFIISNLKFNLFALLQNLMPKAALDMAMFTKKGQNPKLVSQKYDVSVGCGFGWGCGCGKAFRDTFHTKESLLKSKAKAQQDLGNDGGGWLFVLQLTYPCVWRNKWGSHVDVADFANDFFVWVPLSSKVLQTQTHLVMRTLNIQK